MSYLWKDDYVLRVEIIRDTDGSPEGALVAQCYPHDIGAQAKDLPTLFMRLAAVWEAEIRYAAERGQEIPLHPAARTAKPEDTQQAPASQPQDAFEALATMRSALKAIQTGYWDLDTNHEEFRGRVGQIATDVLERCEAVSDEPGQPVLPGELVEAVRECLAYFELMSVTGSLPDQCRAALSSIPDPLPTVESVRAACAQRERMIVSHATSGATTGEGLTVDEISLRVSELRSAIWIQALEKGAAEERERLAVLIAKTLSAAQKDALLFLANRGGASSRGDGFSSSTRQALLDRGLVAVEGGVTSVASSYRGSEPTWVVVTTDLGDSVAARLRSIQKEGK